MKVWPPRGANGVPLEVPRKRLGQIKVTSGTPPLESLHYAYPQDPQADLGGGGADSCNPLAAMR